MFNNKKGSDAFNACTVTSMHPVLLSIKPLMNNQDEGFLIGRRELSGNIKNRTHSHIRITEVAPSNSTIVNGEFMAFLTFIVLWANSNIQLYVIIQISKETICMKYQSLYSGKKLKNEYFKTLPAEIFTKHAQRLSSDIKCFYWLLSRGIHVYLNFLQKGHHYENMSIQIY